MPELDETDDLKQALLMATSLEGSLNERLAAYAAALRQFNTPFAEAVDLLVQRLAMAKAGMTAPNVGEQMPSFMLPDDKGHLTTLEELLVTGPAAIAFHRGHWCPYCSITNDALSEIEADAREAGGRIVAITPDRRPYVGKFKASAQSSFPILSDIDNGYALSLGLAIWVGEELRGFMEAIGRDLGTYQGNESWFLPIPATFVVRSDRIIVARHVDVDYRNRMDLKDLLEALRCATVQST